MSMWERNQSATDEFLSLFTSVRHKILYKKLYENLKVRLDYIATLWGRLNLIFFFKILLTPEELLYYQKQTNQ